MCAVEIRPHKNTHVTVMAALLLLCGVVVLQALRVRLVADVTHVKTKRDIYALPSPNQAKTLSLGYRSALAELIFANVLVESGLHLQAHRQFDTLAAYLYTVIALDPKYPTPYRLADTLLTFQAGKPRLKNYEDAREILMIGMRELPYDQELHLNAGQFMAYLAAPHIEGMVGHDAAQHWRLEGARALARSCELIGHNEEIPYHCITAAKLFSGAGERDAVKNFLQRVLAVNDDENIRRFALDYLGQAMGKAEEQEAEIRFNDLDKAKKLDLPFISKNRYLLLTPPYTAVNCVGDTEGDKSTCATSFADWHARRALRAK